MTMTVPLDARAALMPRPLTPIAASRVAGAKGSYSVRRVPADAIQSIESQGRPMAGDLLLARVERLGQHKHLEDRAGRRAVLWPGDEIIVAYGNRYAPDQFEALVPDDLDPCHLVASGGIASRVISRHANMRLATLIEPIGLLADGRGKRINLRDWRLPALPQPGARPYTIAVLGASMNAGKTTVCTGLIRGLRRRGLRVGAAKITGTGSGNDRWAMVDAGATPVLDFTDAGHATTFGLSGPQTDQTLTTLTGQLAAAGVEASVLEIADGLLQRETAALVSSGALARAVDAVVFAGNGAMSAIAGVDILRRAGLSVMAVSGVMTMSPLASREAAQATGLPVLGLDELAAGRWYADLVPALARSAAA